MLATSGRIFAATALAAFASALAWAPLASAADPVAEGRTILKLNASLYKHLQDGDVRLLQLKPGTARGRTVTLPVSGGELDPQGTSANFDHEGGFKLIAGRRVVTVRKLSLDTTEGELSGRVDGQELRIASLRGFFAKPKGFGIGSIALGGPGTAFSKLESLGAQMGIWGASESWRAPGETYFRFEVEPTAVTPDASVGVLAAPGNDGTTMEIHAPSRNMLLRGPRIDLASRELSATISALSPDDPTATIATLDYGEAKFQIRPNIGVFELMDIRAIATQFIADRLNERFATPGLFQAGETLARVTATLRTR